jgi:hypothetical protein
MTQETSNTNKSPSAEGQPVKGRSVFVVETTSAGIAVQTALLTEGDQLIPMPAIFPDVQYAFDQIDELKRLVSQHFSQAAQLGAQVVEQQANSKNKPSN